MGTVSNSMILISLAGLLLSPLLYALRTLLKMQGKIMYPLLRIKGNGGTVMTIVRTMREISVPKSATVKSLLINPARQAGLSNKEV